MSVHVCVDRMGEYINMGITRVYCRIERACGHVERPSHHTDKHKPRVQHSHTSRHATDSLHYAAPPVGPLAVLLERLEFLVYYILMFLQANHAAPGTLAGWP